MAMPSVIPLTPGVGEKMGESFGTGLSSGFQALANMKLQQATFPNLGKPPRTSAASVVKLT